MTPRTSARPTKLGVGTELANFVTLSATDRTKPPEPCPRIREISMIARMPTMPSSTNSHRSSFAKAMLAMNLRMAEPLDDTYHQWVGSVAPHPDYVSNSV